MSATSKRQGVIPVLPRTVESAIDPILGSYRVSPINIELVLGDEINRVLRQKAFLPIGSLAASISSTTTSIPLPVSGLDGQLLYIEDETIRLGTYSDGVYVSSTRAYHGSTAAYHRKGKNAYDLIPRWRNRMVYLETYDDRTNQWRVRWRGYLQEKRTKSNGTTLELRCISLLSALKRAKINRDAPDLRNFGYITPIYSTIEPFNGSISYISRVRKLDQTTAPIVVRAGDSMLVVPKRNAAEYDFSAAKLVDYQPPESPGDPNPQDVRGPIREMLVVSKKLDVLYGDVSFTSNLPYPYHPASIALALMSGTDRVTEDVAGYDITTPAWSHPINPWLSFNSWVEVIEATREIEIDQLFLGFDGPENILNIIIDVLLRPYGLFMSPTEDGLLALTRFQTIDVSAFCEAQANGLKMLSPKEGGIEPVWTDGLGSAVDVIGATVGKTPTKEGVEVLINTRGGSARDLFLSDAVVNSYDLRTIDRVRVADYGDGDVGDDATNALISAAIIANWQSPRLACSVPDSALFDRTYDLGKYYTIAQGPDDPFFTTTDGERIVLPSLDRDEQIQFVGMMVSRKYVPQSSHYDVELLLLAYRTGNYARMRAPSMEVDAYNGLTQVISSAIDSQFSSIQSDAANFKQGDQVVLVNRFGVTLDGPVTIDAVSAPELQLDAGFSVDPMAQTHPTYLELADSTVYNNTAHYGCDGRPWTYLADANNTIDRPASASVSADIYG
jgi:hypothetical protein